MASRAMTRAQPADWRAAFRRSLARAGQLAGAVALGAATVFLALALVSYTQTDPSASTAAGEDADMSARAGEPAQREPARHALFGREMIMAIDEARTARQASQSGLEHSVVAHVGE